MKTSPKAKHWVKQALFALCLLGLGIVLPACHHRSTLKDLNWLIGTWEGKTNGNTTYEKWSKLNDSTFHATAAFSKNNVVTETQTMNLYALKDSLVYEIAPGGNDSTLKPTQYVLDDEFNIKIFSFNNPQKSFPTVIRYQRITNDSMTVTLSGKINKSFQTVVYPYKRAKEL